MKNKGEQRGSILFLILIHNFSSAVMCETGLIQELGEGHSSKSGNVTRIKKKRPKTGIKHNRYN